MRNSAYAALLLVAPFILKANPVEATFVGVNGTIDFGYYVGPYYGKLDQQSVVLDCVDFANDVSFGQRWAGNLSHIDAGSDLGNTRFGNRVDALQLYQEAAWLTLQYSLNPTTAYGDIQATIWQLFDRFAPSPSTGYWLAQAQANYSAGSYGDFFVVTNVGPVNSTGQVQEFLTVLNPSMPVYPQSSQSFQFFAPTSAVTDTPEPQLLGAVALSVICLAALIGRRKESGNSGPG